MKRKLVIITLSYIIGLIWGLYFYKNITSIFVIIFIIMISFFKKKLYCCLIIIIILISCIYNVEVKKKYDFKYSKIENVKITGTIVKEYNQENNFKKYIIKVNSINDKIDLKNKKILVSEKISKMSKSSVKYGDLVGITGSLEQGIKNTNYKGFNYNEYLRSKKIYGIIQTESNNIKVYKNDNISLYNKKIYQFYNIIKQKIYLILPENSAKLCCAIILGEKSDIDENIIQNFSESSLSHILAISGMHMTYLITIFSLILKSCGKKSSKIILILIIAVFCNLVGNSESIVRATIMTIMYIIGTLLHRKSDSISNLSLAVLLILISNPYSIKSMSFILSFGGTLGIILFSKPIKQKLDYIKIMNKNAITKYIKESIIISISANIIIIPIIAMYFNKISFTFIISNVFASIILSIIMPLIFIFIFMSFFSISFTKSLSFILNFFLCLLLLLSEVLAKIRIFNFTVHTPYKITIIFYYIMLLLISVKYNRQIKHIRKKVLKLVINIYLCICIILNLIRWIDTNMYIFFIDVGQGDSALIITSNNKKILVDGGGSENGEDYVGKDILLPYLLDRRINKLDYVIISHFDSDHCKGILYVMEKLNVENIIIGKQFEDSENYQKLLKIANIKKNKICVVEAGDRINIERDAFFDILWPSSDNVINTNVLNNNSLVCKMVYRNFSILFTGDIEEIAENEILKKYENNKEILKTDILKVAHHGSKTSSTEQFLNYTKPKFALIGVGRNNKFGHPSNLTIDNLNNIKSKIYRTDLDGEISIQVSKNSVTINTLM